MPRMEIQGETQVDVSQLSDDGWSTLVKLEIQMLRELNMDFSSRTALMCHRAKQAADAKGAISTRLKSLLQGTALGRTLWTALKDAADAAISPSSLTNEVKERAEAIKRSGIDALLDGSHSGQLLLDVVARHPTLVPALVKTKEALTQLPGSVDASCMQEHQLVDKVVNLLAGLVQAHAEGALDILAQSMHSFWNQPMPDSRWYKHMDVFFQALLSCKARQANICHCN